MPLSLTGRGLLAIPAAGLLTLRPGQHVGCLAIQLSSRRRVRVKGVVQSVERTAAGLLSLQVRVQQAYGNCPKYIQVGRGEGSNTSRRDDVTFPATSLLLPGADYCVISLLKSKI